MNEGTAKSQSGSGEKPHFARPGFSNIAPYMLVEGAAEFIDFLKAAFGAEERVRVPMADGSIMHAELRLQGALFKTLIWWLIPVEKRARWAARFRKILQRQRRCYSRRLLRVVGGRRVNN